MPKSWELIFRASKDGFTGENYKAKCLNIPNLLILVRSSSDERFGGFQPEKMSGSGKQVSSKDAFIFSLTKNRMGRIKNRDAAFFYVGKGYLVSFGYGDNAMILYDNCNENTTSRVTPSGIYDLVFEKRVQFMVKEIEVFKMV